MKLTAEQQALLPSDEEVKFYQEHGWYITKQILSDEEMENALAGADEVYEGHRDARLPVDLDPRLYWTPDQEKDVLRANHYIVQQNLKFRNLAFNPLIGAIAARLSGSSQIRTFLSALFYKPPQNSGDVQVGWHTDRAYWNTCTSDNMLTAWIPLHDCNAEMGTLVMIDGSHLWEENEIIDELRSGRTFSTKDLAALEVKLNAAGMPIKKIPMNLKRGQMSFHHCNLLHGSGPNRSDFPRQTLILHLQDKDNKYRVALKENGEKIVHHADKLCTNLADGTPDYSDPLIFPVLWENDD